MIVNFWCPSSLNSAAMLVLYVHARTSHTIYGLICPVTTYGSCPAMVMPCRYSQGPIHTRPVPDTTLEHRYRSSIVDHGLDGLATSRTCSARLAPQTGTSIALSSPNEYRRPEPRPRSPVQNNKAA
ncbi:hypothetical protein GGR56DRAFT_634363 [Xylariaceae sp. FL0804]|nr:hypothetical protein GGR56DRAFT_634363 [Xylariaceae sp. FL0804]